MKTSPSDTSGMPSGIPYIIGNEAAERFSFYGMRAILVVFMTKYLWLMGDTAGTAMTEYEANAKYHLFNAAVYFTPIVGALLSDIVTGKYRIIMWLSLVYCAGHAALAFMGVTGDAAWWLYLGLFLICIGSGGIKPCVSAHVGDQFGKNNQHLLTRIFNWFYFSINLGAFISSLLTPWTLEWYGPHWAFGIPGVLMALATFVFWLGRRKFVHVPPAGKAFTKELFSKKGGQLILKLLPLYLFVAVFWALFDQTGSSWIFQAEDMNRTFLGMTWLPSQIQAINPIFILILIPFFTALGYPAISKFFPLSPLRKIGIGLFIMVSAFATVALIQENIAAGGTPSIGWQFLAYVLLTASEIMVSIVCLEFSYTQAPKSMKSFIMAFYLLAVFMGNLFASGVNWFIQNDEPVAEHFVADDFKEGAHNHLHPGYDGQTNTGDDIAYTSKDGSLKSLTPIAHAAYDDAAAKITQWSTANNKQLPDTETGNQLIAGITDQWGHPLTYTQRNRITARIASAGPDNEPNTRWDLGTILTLNTPEPGTSTGESSWIKNFQPSQTWLETRKAELGITGEIENDETKPLISSNYFVGGQSRLEGPAYFWFFTALMATAAILFLPYSIKYRYEA